VEVQIIQDVIAADMMMTYQEDQLDEEVRKLDAEEVVPEMLNDGNMDPSKILYNGDLKKKDIFGKRLN